MSDLELEFDDLTGQDLPETIAKRQEQAAAEAVLDMEKLGSLEKHPGWLLIKEAIQNTIAKETEALLHSTAPDTIRYFQSLIKARTELLGWISIKVAEGRSILDERDQKGPGTNPG